MVNSHRSYAFDYLESQLPKAGHFVQSRHQRRTLQTTAIIMPSTIAHHIDSQLSKASYQHILHNPVIGAELYNRSR
jgi:hypothetical protein